MKLYTDKNKIDGISINGLKKTYNTFSLSIPSLVIERGTIWGLVGPNGAGKSTTMNILMGITSPEEGKIEVFGKDFEEDSVVIKQSMGCLPEGLGLFDQLTGYEQLYLFGRIYGLPEEVIAERSSDLLKLFELFEMKDWPIYQYSTGMKKKLSFACAVIHRPKILFLDEPLESIDPVSVIIIKEMIIAMAASGCTVVMTSHNLDSVEKLCQEVAIMNAGKIVFQSALADIRKNLKNKVGMETAESLEEIFVACVSDHEKERLSGKLSWL